MGSRRRHVVVALLAGLALLAAGCGDDDADETTGGGEARETITIGAFNFSESAILAAIYEGALEAEGFTVTVRPNLGSREVVAPALERGEINLYPGYAATELEFFNKGAGEASPDPQATVQRLRTHLEPKGITALDPSPAIDANAFAVTRATAERYNLRKLSDLAPVAGQLVLGGPPECPTRPFCALGLEQTYGIKFREFKQLDAGGPLSKSALERGDVDVALIFSSDGAIPARGFVVLEDDKKLQNADNVVPIITTRAATDDVRRVLNRVSAALTTEELTQMNKRAELDKEDPSVLAEGWLRENGFTRS
ncbi:MAG TPA: ABC transporter substrate-binding protein [Acidimicrobiales bacterium]|nr:ABC transporter substrate-binding protein [Acidimicrobiales bacterium]